VFARHNISRFGPAVLSALIALEALITAALILQNPSEAESGAVFGYSVPRVLIVGILIVLVVLAGGASVALFRSEKRRALIQNWILIPANLSWTLWSTTIIGVLAWIALFTPGYRLGSFGGYFVRLAPLFMLIILIAIETVFIFYVEVRSAPASQAKPVPAKFASPLRGWGIIMAIIILTWTLIASTGLGVKSNGEDYWYEVGVPVLALQVLLALAIGLMAAWFEGAPQKSNMPPRSDLLIFLAIWFITGWIWVLTPIPGGYFNTLPLPPTYEAYPFSDAALFDLQSQSALIGEGLNNGRGLTRPAYPAFLVLIHVITGQDYDRNMNLQAGIFAVFPALIFLIGKALVNRSAGIAAAALLTFRGVNSIAATATLNLANPKQMLPDFPVGIGIALAMLLCILWFNAPGRLRLLFFAGGAITLALYLRQTTLGIIPAVVLMIYFASRNISKKWFLAGLTVLLAGYLVASSPWEIRNRLSGSSGLYPSSIKKIFFILEHRFPVVDPALEPDSQSTIGPRDNGGNGAQPQDGKDFDRDAPQTSDLILLTQLDPRLITNHFLHNLVTSTLILPDSVVLHDLRTTTREQSSYWRSSWDGNLTPGKFFLLGVNLGLVALGVLAAMKRNLSAGLLPAGIFLGYHLANAFGRTSGGRYIVPVDWIIGFYFMLGLMQAGVWFFGGLRLLKPIDQQEARLAVSGDIKLNISWSMMWPALCLLAAGSLLVFPDFSFPQVYEKVTSEQLADRISAYGPYRIEEPDQAFINKFLRENGKVYTGKILYPRYAAGNASGELFFLGSQSTVEYPLLAFALLGPDGSSNVNFAFPEFDEFPNYSDAIVMGCRQGEIVDAAMVILLSPIYRVYTRQSSAPAECPLPEPVCDGNGNCN
jgi:hypothetical protein